MDSRTGQIYAGITDVEAKKHDLVPIPDDDLARVQRMNRHDRRAWAAQQRRKTKAVP